MAMACPAMDDDDLLDMFDPADSAAVPPVAPVPPGNGSHQFMPRGANKAPAVQDPAPFTESRPPLAPGDWSRTAHHAAATGVSASSSRVPWDRTPDPTASNPSGAGGTGSQLPWERSTDGASGGTGACSGSRPPWESAVSDEARPSGPFFATPSQRPEQRATSSQPPCNDLLPPVAAEKPAAPVCAPPASGIMPPWNGQLVTREVPPDQLANRWMPRRYPADPHKKLRRAVIHHDRETLLQALALGGGMGRDKSGKTAMHYAANRGNYEFLHILLSHGLDPNARGDSGYTVVDEAEYWAFQGSEADRALRRRCRDLLTVFGGRRSRDSDHVNSDRMKLERQNYGQRPPWRDDEDDIARQCAWMKDTPHPPSPGSQPSITYVADSLPEQYENSDEGYWEPPPQPRKPLPAPVEPPQLRPAEPPARRGEAASSSCKVQVEEPPSLRDLIPSHWDSYEEWKKDTFVIRDALLELAQNPRDLWVRKPPVRPAHPSKYPSVEL